MNLFDLIKWCLENGFWTTIGGLIFATVVGQTLIYIAGRFASIFRK
jgi:hypothetical protein